MEQGPAAAELSGLEEATTGTREEPMSAIQTKALRQRSAQHARPPEAWRTASLHRTAEINGAVQPLTEAMLSAGYTARETFGVHLALEEALVNAIRHGHAGDPSKRVRLRYLLGDEFVIAEVQDEGPGFRLQNAPDPLAPENLERDCGRGLFLIRHYMTWVRHNPAGNCVTMCKRRGAE
jgi:serine/threonine-protein kinase RsbW